MCSSNKNVVGVCFINFDFLWEYVNLLWSLGGIRISNESIKAPNNLKWTGGYNSTNIVPHQFSKHMQNAMVLCIGECHWRFPQSQSVRFAHLKFHAIVILFWHVMKSCYMYMVFPFCYDIFLWIRWHVSLRVPPLVLGKCGLVKYI